MHSISKYYTRGDFIVTLAFAALSAGGAFGVTMLNGGGRHVRVEVDGRRVVEASLNTPARYSVAGPLGDTVVEIRDGSVRVVESPCPGKYCVKSGTAGRRGEAIVCVPNHVIVTVTGDESSGYDGVTQ